MAQGGVAQGRSRSRRDRDLRRTRARRRRCEAAPARVRALRRAPCRARAGPRCLEAYHSRMGLLKRLKRKLKQADFLPFDRSDRISELKGRTVENDDAWAQGGSGGDQFPI